MSAPLQAGDILLELDTDKHLLLCENDMFDNGDTVHARWCFYIFEDNTYRWWYTDFLEDERDYARIA